MYIGTSRQVHLEINLPMTTNLHDYLDQDDTPDHLSIEPLILGSSVMALSLTLMLGTAMILSVYVFYMECSLIDDLEGKCKNYKKHLVMSTGSKSGVYKAAISFRPVIVQTTYPFCNVNRSTFFEWCNASVNNLVSLLVSF